MCQYEEDLHNLVNQYFPMASVIIQFYKSCVDKRTMQNGYKVDHWVYYNRVGKVHGFVFRLHISTNL